MSALHHPHCTCLELLENGAASLCRGLGDPFRRPGSRPVECVYRGQGAHLLTFCPLFPGLGFLLHHISHWMWLDLDLLLYLGPECPTNVVSCHPDLIQFPLIYVKQDFLPWSVYNAYNRCPALPMAPFYSFLDGMAYGSWQWLRAGLGELAGAEFWIWGLIIGIIATRITALSVSLSLRPQVNTLDLEWMFQRLNWDETCTVKCADLKYTTQWVLTDAYTHVADTLSQNISLPFWYFLLRNGPAPLNLETWVWTLKCFIQ